MGAFRRVTRRILPVLTLTLISCLGPQDPELTTEPPSEADPTLAPTVPTTAPTPSVDLTRALELGQPVRVIVVLDSERITPSTTTRSLTPADAARRAVRFASAKQDLFLNAPRSLILEQELEQLPLAAATLTGPDALAHLLASPDVAQVYPDQLNTISLAQSLPLIKQPEAALEGKDGTGTSVAVLDTGADYRVADLGSCTSTGAPASCRVAWAQDFATNDNLLDDSGKHGTNVSSIVAAVAPGAKILALDVFDGASGYDSVIINAINWVIANRATYNIVAMNLSLGGGSYTAACPNTPMAIAIQEARNAGVLAAIATGNSATTNAISSPACAPAAVSVGAVYDANVGPLNSAVCSDATSVADKVTCFSNSASFMTLLAPGAFITAGGVTMAGTSQATPHVAGALAVLRSAFPTETVDDTVARLTSTGPLLTDARNGVVKPRLDVQAAAAGCVFKLSPPTRTITSADSTFSLALTTTSTCAWSVTSNAAWLTVTSADNGTGSATLTLHAIANPGAARTGTLTVSGAASTVTASVTQGIDTTAPTGTITINEGAALTRTLTVALTLSGADASGVASMCLTNTTSCTSYEPFATARVWTLANAQGVQTVRLFLRDTQGNTALAGSDTITVDTVAPTGGTATAASLDTSATVSWTAATDTGSGIDKYRLVFATGTTAPASCTTGTTAFEGAAMSFTHTGLTNGTSYAYRVCALDRAGNLSAGVTASARPKPESAGPVGTVSINAGAAYTKTAAVTLTLSATDASAVSQVCLSSTLPCTAWQAYATSKPFTLATSEGVRTVYALFKDEWGNVSAAAAQDTIVLDTVVPVTTTASSVYGDASATVSWAAATDTTSGVAGYRVVVAATTAPANCTTGTVAWEGSALSFTHTGLTNGTLYAYRVCAVDKAGNMNVGVTTSTQPRPESAGPIGAFTINGGAAYTRSGTVTLALNPTDASPVTQVCLATTLPCTAWQPFATTKTFTLPSPDGNKVVYALFKDKWGNLSSTAAQASIVLDLTAPSTLTASSVYGDASATISWTAATDATSGLDVYRVVAAPTTAPANCATGTLAYQGTARSFTHSGLTNGTLYAYRVCAVDKAGNVNAGAITSTQPRPESDGPVAAFTINGGATYTKSSTVTLTLSPTDASTVSQVCVSVTLPCTAWQPYAATKTFSLPSPDGRKTLYASFKDVWNNVSPSAAQASITLDLLAPNALTASSAYGDASATVSWTASSDATSGLDKYRVVFATSTAPANCTSGAVAYEGPATSFTHTGRTNGTLYAYRVCALDKAGNINTGATTSTQPRPESDGPVGAITINGGAAFTKSASVTLNLAPTDASTVTQVCVTSTLPCTAWQAFATSKPFTLLTGDGNKVVYATFKDVWGNPSAATVSASIGLDTTAPTESTLSGTAGSKQNALSWSTSSDSGSGGVTYRVVMLVGTTAPPAKCTSGTVLSDGAGQSFTHASLTAGTSYAYRVCAKDTPGNVSNGTTVVLKAQP